MIGRYVLATAAVVLLVVGLLLGAVVYLGLHYGAAADSRVRIGTLAEALTPTADGLQLDPARTPADWLQGYAWAMALDDDGSVIWQHDLPQNLNKHYTASEIASFSRWYLDDWPVFCWTADYGLFVAAVPRGSVWKYNICNNEQLMNAMAAGMLPALALLLGVAAACCLLFSWRGARRLQTIAAGLDTVADGGTIRLPTDGFAGELADRGACVTLVTGRTELPTPAGVERVDVLSAAEMYDAAVRAFEGSDGAVMCAAVADYTPDRVSDTKIKKCDGDMCITLRRTRDIAAELGAHKDGRLLVGFALETHDEQAHAEAKLEKKNFDFIVLNSLRDAGAGFRGDTNKVTFIDRTGREELPLLSKREVAERIAERIEEFFAE